MTIILTTDRLVLREMNKTDVTNLLEIFSDPIAMKYYPSTKDEAAANQWIDWTLQNYENHGIGLWIVEDKLTGNFLGQCGIVPQEVEGVIEMEIGYLFARRAWGNGFATESARACREYGFDKLERRKMISLINPNNLPSIHVAQRNGMQLEKRLHWKGKDTLVYAVLKEEKNKK